MTDIYSQPAIFKSQQQYPVTITGNREKTVTFLEFSYLTININREIVI